MRKMYFTFTENNFHCDELVTKKFESYFSVGYN